MKLSTVYFICFFILTGCAVKPISSIQRINDLQPDLQITLSGSDKDIYALVDQNRRVISLSSGEQKVLKFAIPQSTRMNQCFSVLNQKGENFIEDNPHFRLLLIQEFREIAQKKQDIENQIQENLKNEQKYRNLQSSTLSALESSRAFQKGTCYLPPQKPLPIEPNTACNSHDECVVEGSAICYTRFFRKKGCGIAFSVLNIPGKLSSPGCGAWAANLAGEKYGMGNALADFLHGTADDLINDLINSDSGWKLAAGLLAKGMSETVKIKNAQQCTDEFVERHFGPKKRWLDAVNDLKAEPLKTQNRCFALIKEVNQYAKNVAHYKNANNPLYDVLNIANSSHSSFFNKISEITSCYD